MIKLVRLLLCLMFLAGMACAPKGVKSVPHAEGPKDQYNSMLIAVIGDLKTQNQAENQIAESMATRSLTRFVPSISLFTPGRNFANPRTMETLKKNNIQSILFIVPEKTGVEPVTITIPGAPLNMTADGQGVQPGAPPTRTETDLTLSNDVVLFDIEKRRVVWQAHPDRVMNSVRSMVTVITGRIGRFLYNGGYLIRTTPTWPLQERR